MINVEIKVKGVVKYDTPSTKEKPKEVKEVKK